MWGEGRWGEGAMEVAQMLECLVQNEGAIILGRLSHPVDFLETSPILLKKQPVVFNNCRKPKTNTDNKINIITLYSICGSTKSSTQFLCDLEFELDLRHVRLLQICKKKKKKEFN